jgi:hypothetical protein
MPAELDPISYSKANKATKTLASMSQYIDVLDNGSDEYPIDCNNQPFINVAITTLDADAKEITEPTNVPTRCEIFIELTYTNAAAITWWLAAAEWLSGSAPSLTAGKVYYIAAMTSNGGTNWRANCVGGW